MKKEETKQFNARTQDQPGMVIPVVITVYADRSFTFVTKTPPAAVLLKKAAGLDAASGEPNKKKVATLTRAQAEEIAKTKMPDLNAANLESATEMIKGTATEEEVDELEEASALQDISHMPARVKCAVLGWRTLREALEKTTE